MNLLVLYILMLRVLHITAMQDFKIFMCYVRKVFK